MEEGAKALSDIPAINRFLSYCRIRTVPSKTVIIHAGDLPDILYYIISGSVEVMIEDEDGNEMVLAYLNKGQFFGEMGLFYEQPTRSAWVRTRQQSELAEMTYPRFRQIAAESPGLIFELATQLATRLDRSRLCRRHRPRGARHHGFMRRTRCDDASGRHANQSQPAGAFAPGGLFPRNGGTRPQSAGGAGIAARHR
jgi:CRP-like cAMP-binding protein